MFNIRIYGIWIQNNSVLLCEEFIRDIKVVKLPGGGLEQGEGTIDCLKREFNEELGFIPEQIEHFYTTDFYVQSMADQKDQIISIYYLVRDEMQIDLTKFNKEDLFFFWKDLEELTVEDVSLPIDKVVVERIKEQRTKNKDNFW